MIDCQKAFFSPSLQQQRLEQARSVLGERVVDRLLCFLLMSRTILDDLVKTFLTL